MFYARTHAVVTCAFYCFLHVLSKRIAGADCAVLNNEKDRAASFLARCNEEIGKLEHLKSIKEVLSISQDANKLSSTAFSTTTVAQSIQANRDQRHDKAAAEVISSNLGATLPGGPYYNSMYKHPTPP